MSTTNNNNSTNSEGLDGKPYKLVGAIPELGDAVFTIGEKNSLNNYEHVKKKIGYHVGRHLSSDMYNLVQNGRERTFKQPGRPSKVTTRAASAASKGEAGDDTIPQVVDPYDMKEFDKEFESYLREKKAAAAGVLLATIRTTPQVQKKKNLTGLVKSKQQQRVRR